MSVTVRGATRDDLDAIEAIEKACFGDPWSRNSLAGEIEGDPRRLPLVAVDGDDVVAFAFYWVIADEIHLVNVAVAPAHRRQGIAQLLLDHVIEGEVGRNAAIITLEVRITNVGAIALYRRNGFRDIALREKYYPDTGEDALIMLKRLGPSASGGPRGL